MSDNSKNSDNNFQNINLSPAKEFLKLTLDQALFNIRTNTAAKLLYNKTKQEMQQEQPSTDPEHIANELLNKLRLH